MDLSKELTRPLNGSWTNLPPKPSFELVKKLPLLNPKAVERAVINFIEEAKIKDDRMGFLSQTLESIAQAVIFNVPGCDFWMAEKEGEVVGYALARIVKDIDNRLCYWVSQGWVRKDFRNGQHIRDSWKKLEEYAKKMMCSHIVNVTNRNPQAYLRLLGEGWDNYATLLKKDL